MRRLTLILTLAVSALGFLAANASATITTSPTDGGSCYDPADPSCGVGWGESGEGVEVAWAYGDDYDAYQGRCRTRWAKAHRQNPVGITQFDYYEQVKWCWRNGVVTRFHRDRWVGQTGLGWSFDGHIGTNCGSEGCDGRTGAWQEDAWTQGQFHICWAVWGIGYCQNKYPIISIVVFGNGWSYANVSGV